MPRDKSTAKMVPSLQAKPAMGASRARRIAQLNDGTPAARGISAIALDSRVRKISFENLRAVGGKSLPFVVGFRHGVLVSVCWIGWNE